MTDILTKEQFKALKKGKASKFGNEKTVVGGITFDSKKEAARFQDLLLMQKAGVIEDLWRQMSYELCVNGKKVCVYIADFNYVDVKTGTIITEDCKGYRTKEYRLKAKMFEAQYGRKILET